MLIIIYQKKKRKSRGYARHFFAFQLLERPKSKRQKTKICSAIEEGLIYQITALEWRKRFDAGQDKAIIAKSLELDINQLQALIKRDQ